MSLRILPPRDLILLDLVLSATGILLLNSVLMWRCPGSNKMKFMLFQILDITTLFSANSVIE